MNNSEHNNAILPWQHEQWQKLQFLRSQGQLPHALLFVGQQGIGKKRFADDLAKSLLCLDVDHSGYSCGRCQHCQLYQAGNNPNIQVISPEEEGKQIKIDVIRQLVGELVLATNEGSFNVVIIEPAEAMNKAAANALLKTLEEPVARTLLILICNSPHLLLPTIKSRCRTIRFPTPDSKAAVDWLQAQRPQIKMPENQLRINGGAPIKALKAIDEAWQDKTDTLFEDFMNLTKGRADAVEVAGRWYGFDMPDLLVEQMMTWIMDMVRWKLSANPPTLYHVEQSQGLQTVAERLDLQQLTFFLKQLYDYKSEQFSNLNPQLAMENLLIEWLKTTTGEKTYGIA